MICWQLRYADGQVRDERVSALGASIKDAPPMPVAIVVTRRAEDDTRTPLKASTRSYPYNVPIWYRHRYLDVGPGSDEQIHTEAVVFGWATKEGEAKLWLWDGDKAVACPERFYAANAIKHLVSR